MKTVGIIVEYNPLHNGHLHHINETKRLSGCDVLVCVMSGNFTQRGEPALIDKFTRTKMALNNGVDLVIELPFVFSVQSADVFSYTSVALLHHIGVDEIYFGSESGDISKLEELADVISSKPYNDLLKLILNQGNSYPTASDMAMKELHPQSDYDLPNNILGIQYITAVRKLNSKIKLFTIPRLSTGYYSEETRNTNIQSATAIRKLLLNNSSIRNYVPKDVYELLENRKIIHLDLFSDQMKYIISSSKKEDLVQIFNMTEGIDNRILKTRSFESVSDLVNQLLTRRYTNSKIKRNLIHILCNTKANLIDSFEIPYIRILGMNNTGKGYLNTIKKDMTVPLITKIKEKKHPYLEHEIHVSKIYQLVSDIDVFKEEFKPVIYLRFD